ncbi:STAS domain-containing protein [Quadrisphaera sp. DSM 44207]|uniref:STAS domain-containing protein n=1 Tax=Quadrisphaera sp. DSM 44207 TaxID=1881057 RepID=UPI00088D4AA9|nr:STAS domain-containing protein [Quadrisphaera sp. DSM 44207]SDQ87582.1 anti-anti-sigma factor [Quadrisphaera sp. DSM 44207]
MDDGGLSGAAGAPAEPGSVHVILGSRKTRVVLTGEIDAELGPDLLEASADAEEAGRPVEVDVQHVTFMDSTGVAFLARLASRSPQQLVLIKPPDLVRFLIQVTSISEVLRVVEQDPGVDSTLPDRPDGPDGDDHPDLIA